MNKNLLILVGKKGEKNKLFCKLLTENIGKEVKVSLDTFSNLYIELGLKGINLLVGNCDIKTFNLIYFRRIDHFLFPLSGTLALILDKLGIKYFDSKFKEIGAGGDKFTSFTKLYLNGISVPKTIYTPRERIWEERESIFSSLKFPFIAKDTKAQGNQGIYLISKEKDLKKLLEEHKVRESGSPIQFLFQEFVEIENEFRLLVLKDEVKVVHTKVKRDYTNLVVGYKKPEEEKGEGQKIPEPEIRFIDPSDTPFILKDTAIRAAQVLGTEIAGVDICIEKKTGRVIVIEVNRGPGFEYDATCSPEISEVSKFLKKEIDING